MKLGVVDEVLKEPHGGAHRDPQAMADDLKLALVRHLGELDELSEDELLRRRYERLRGQGVYTES
jgi:acetyl-CoA carboxylase carboxyl transferase subunit alpha